MKKKTLGRIALCAFALCMVSTCLLSGTLARYTSTQRGTGNVSVASWTGITFSNNVNTFEEAEFTFDLATTKDRNDFANESNVAPGDTGSFEIDLGPADVDYTYTIAITPVTGSVPVKFYNGATEITAGTPLTGEVSNSQTDADGTTVTVNWEWVTADPDNDVNYEGATQNFTITTTARQKLAADTPVEP